MLLSLKGHVNIAQLQSLSLFVLHVDWDREGADCLVSKHLT